MKIGNIEIVMFPAGSGDCILLHFIKEHFRILIDGGYVYTFNNYLKTYLERLGKMGESIDLLIVTHIDRDHINGIKKFLKVNGDAKHPNIIFVKEIWFNGFQNISGIKCDACEEIPFVEKCVLENMAAQSIDQDENGLKDISFGDAESLVELIVNNGYDWNTSFNKMVSRNDTLEVVYGDINISILNPSEKELNNLTQEWIDELKKSSRDVIISNNHLFDRAFEGCWVYDENIENNYCNISFSEEEIFSWREKAELDDDIPDDTIQNLSSIAVLIKNEKKTLLFPGDCPMYQIKKYLPDKIDIVKLPHHGSGKSIDKEFIRTKKVDYYLLSTDGKRYGHPSEKVIGNIVCNSLGNPLIIKNYEIPLLANIGKMEDEVIVDE